MHYVEVELVSNAGICGVVRYEGHLYHIELGWLDFIDGARYYINIRHLTNLID